MFGGGEITFGALALNAMFTPTPERKVEQLMRFSLLFGGCYNIWDHPRHNGFGWLVLCQFILHRWCCLGFTHRANGCGLANARAYSSALMATYTCRPKTHKSMLYVPFSLLSGTDAPVLSLISQ